ncbi:hypothetical protein HYH02_007779 [Chlamydomonas schloesseri]|uniref:Uncharacterized protein n=1 Tax=Chlamydomonas schloesseri TaxID=2026947 RepID=A0A836B4H5_9CHLO|nr:hypothetical protein HYH02_007779 [Chlamydomonas schloesseri]|eukprot:KAG2447456.1 hypothetical protein HYH02_007779 [Chlamydomonas schloesseri]
MGDAFSRRREEDEAAELSQDVARKAVESPPAKASVASADGVCTPQVRLSGVREPTSGAAAGTEAAGPGSRAMHMQPPEEGRTQERPVRLPPTFTISNANSAAPGILSSHGVQLASPPAAQTLSMDAHGPTPVTPPPPHPSSTTTAARTVDPADELMAAAPVSHAEGAAPGINTAAAAAGGGPHVVRNLEAALLTAVATATADAAATDGRIRGAAAAAHAAAAELGEPGPGPHELLSGEGQQQQQQQQQQQPHGTHGGSVSPGKGAHGSRGALPARSAVTAVAAAASHTSRAAASTGGKEAVPRQHSTSTKRVGGSNASAEAAPAAATAAPGAQQQQQQQQQAGTGRIKRMSSNDHHHHTTTTTTTAASTITAAASRHDAEARGALSPADPAAVTAAPLPALSVPDADEAAAVAVQGPLPPPPAPPAHHVPHYLLPTAASMSRRSSQGLVSPLTDSGSHGHGSLTGTAAGTLLARDRSIHLPAAAAAAAAPAAQHHEGGGALPLPLPAVSPRSPTSPGSGLASRAVGRTTSLRRVSQPGGAVSDAAPARSTSRKESAVA